MEVLGWLLAHLAWAALILIIAGGIGAVIGLVARFAIRPSDAVMVRSVGWALIVGLAIIVSFALVSTVS